MISRLTPYSIVLAAVLCLCSSKAEAASPGADPSLKLHFDFDQDFSNGKVPDVTGNGHDGWRFCPTNWITATNGVFGTSGSFWHTNGTITDIEGTHAIGPYIGVTNLAGIEYLTNGTISFWAQFGQDSDVSTVILDAGYSPWYATYPNLATNSWSLRRNYRPYLSFIVFDAAAGQRTIVDWPTDVVQPGGFSADLSTTNFHLYTITFSCPNNQAIAYYDGRPFMTNSIGSPWLRIYSSTPWLAIGAWAHDGTPQWGDDLYPHSGFFDGQMDDLRIYDRALSASEVQSLYVGNTVVLTLQIQIAGPESVQLSWVNQPGVSYQVESKSNQCAAAWWLLGAPISSTGLNNSTLDSIAGRSSGFYRVRVLP